MGEMRNPYAARFDGHFHLATMDSNNLLTFSYAFINHVCRYLFRRVIQVPSLFIAVSIHLLLTHYIRLVRLEDSFLIRKKNACTWHKVKLLSKEEVKANSASRLQYFQTENSVWKNASNSTSLDTFISSI